ncbi:hypothetical protein D3C78_1218560 [compost metagenome]
MQHDGDDEELDPRRDGKLPIQPWRLLRQKPAQYEQAGGAEQQTNAHQASRRPFGETEVTGRLQPRHQQGEHRGGEHHPRTEPQQAVRQPRRDAAQEEHRQRPQRRSQGAERAGAQRLPQVRLHQGLQGHHRLHRQEHDTAHHHQGSDELADGTATGNQGSLHGVLPGGLDIGGGTASVADQAIAWR